MTTSSNRLATIALSAALLGAAACSDSTGAETGTVGVRLTNSSVAGSVAADIVGTEADAPLPAGSVKRVDIFVVRIDARGTEPTEEEAVEASEAQGWVTLAEPNAVIDLMTVADGSSSFLGDAEVAVGSYRGFRLIIDPARSSLTLNDAESTVIGGESIIGLKFPSAAQTGIKINLTGGPVVVEEGEETTLLVKFDVTRSFVARGPSVEQNGLLFKPVVRGELQD